MIQLNEIKIAAQVLLKFKKFVVYFFVKEGKNLFIVKVYRPNIKFEILRDLCGKLGIGKDAVELDDVCSIKEAPPK